MPRGTASEDSTEHGGGRSPRTATIATAPGAGSASHALVVGFDRSCASLAAVQQAARIGDRLTASITVVHAVDLKDFPVDPDRADWERAASRALEAERAAVGVTPRHQRGPVPRARGQRPRRPLRTPRSLVLLRHGQSTADADAAAAGISEVAAQGQPLAALPDR